MIVKYLFFLFHFIFIILNFILLFAYWQILILQFFVILSWYFNNNMCIITQLEDYLFNQTLVEYFKNSKINNISKYKVPYYHRYLLYLSFIIGLYYHSLINKISYKI